MRFRLLSVIAPELRPASIVLVKSHLPPFGDPLAPAHQRGGIDQRAVLEERLPGEVLIVGVLDPTGDHRLVRQFESVLQIHQPGHQPR